MLEKTALVTTPAWPFPKLRLGDTTLRMSDVMAARGELPDAAWLTADFGDAAVSDSQLRKFQTALNRIPSESTRLIVGTHFPVFTAQLGKREITPRSPWFVSPRFGALLSEFCKTRPGTAIELISGHLHEKRTGRTCGIPWQVVHSGYGRPEFLLLGQ
jgi:hypothetical protein